MILKNKKCYFCSVKMYHSFNLKLLKYNHMKNLYLFILAAFIIICPLTLSAQKKKSTEKKDIVPVVNLSTKSDTIAYAIGMLMGQSGLEGHLISQGVLMDTTAVSDDLRVKIANEQDKKKKEKLMKELSFKIDSMTTANQQNLDEFYRGFNQTFNKKEEKTPYNLGVSIATNLSGFVDQFSENILGKNEKFNAEAFSAALFGSLKKEKLLIEDPQSIIQDAEQASRERKENEMAETLRNEYASQIAEGDKFMAENKTKEGVVTLPSGLQYKIITTGTGEKPTAADRVTVHYKGTLIDGTVFDSSIDRGEPTTFGVTQVIKGWTEALQLMPVGSKWILYIPYDLAYGSKDQGVIKPFSNLIFEVELIDIPK